MTASVSQSRVAALPEEATGIAGSGFWDLDASVLLSRLKTSSGGLSRDAAAERFARNGATRLQRKRRSDVAILLAQFNNPIILLLAVSAVLSYLLDDATNAWIILAILLASGLLGFWQERSAANAVARLLAMIETKTTVLRDGVPLEIPLQDVVPGDVVLLRAGTLIPGDCRLLESNSLFVDEAALTGESFPVEKTIGELPSDTPLSRRTNVLFLGTHVISGTATAVVVRTGRSTEFGQVSSRLEQRPPETGFERGLRNFGNLLIKVTLVLVIVVFAVNVYFKRPVVESLLFALALAVGMTPQLLPAITSVVLASGAKAMADAQVIVKQLLAIENFGSMDVLCSDKTGTLTEGVVQLHSVENLAGEHSEKVLRLAYLNAAFETGFKNPIDEAVRSFREFDLSGVRKLDENPYDFVRKRLSLLMDDHGSTLIITKGALVNVVEVCDFAELPTGDIVPIVSQHELITRRFTELSEQGFRVLGLASRNVGRALVPVPCDDLEACKSVASACDQVTGWSTRPTQAAPTRISNADEREMTFLGFLVFFDPPKAGIDETLRQLEQLGIGLKIITGDNRAVARTVGRQVGIREPRILSGSELRRLSEDALRTQAHDVDLFAEVEPNQKERIILALQKSGHIVGYLGDGINDASALHAADVGISVASAVDVAREAAQVVLLNKDLGVLVQGVLEGRKTFANTLKYVYFSVSANFGYMFSIAVASLLLPFLPLLPVQILMVNLLADFPAMALATDSVDPEVIERPRRWDVRALTRFMLLFGLSSSTFDFLTFGCLLLGYNASITEFRTGWWIVSVLTGVIIMLAVRTQRPFFRSQPGRWLLIAAGSVAVVAVLLPFSPFAGALEFVSPSIALLGIIAGIAILYGITMEFMKRIYYRTQRSAG